MAYLEQLIMQSRIAEQQQFSYSAASLGNMSGQAYASFYPEWEVTTPQHQTPSAWSLAQMGYRTNELVFTCINVRADAIGEASLMVMDNKGKTPEEITNHEVRMLLENPCPGIGEQTFWKIVETYLGIAGFSAWEKQRNNKGDVVGLWPMRPDWCSFLRGQQKPLRAIRYQPNGLPPLDIPIEDILLFQYFDPLYPLLKAISPTMNALEMIDTDNNMTLLINTFLKNGAFLSGILTSENQVLQEAEATVYRERWRQAHSGFENAGDIAVLGKGLKYQGVSSTFRDMVFPEVDARSEARICMTFRVPPMLIGAKIGIDRSTFTNYPEARKGFYEGPISSEWKFLASVANDSLVPEFEESNKGFLCKFDTRGVAALQQDRNAQIDRAVNMYKTGKIATLDEAREEAGLDPIGGEEGKAFFAETAPADSGFGDEAGTDTTPEEGAPDDATLELQTLEEKRYKVFAKKRIKEGHYNDLREYEFMYLPQERQDKLIKSFEAMIIVEQLREAVV